jgi:hypothetical protein
MDNNHGADRYRLKCEINDWLTNTPEAVIVSRLL